MLKRNFHISVFGVVLVLGQLSAQQPTRDPQALSILLQSHAVLGASGVGVTDSLAEGSIVCSDGSEGTITLKTKGPNRLRSEVNFGYRQVISVFRDGRGRQTADGQDRQLPIWVTKYYKPFHLPAFSRLADFLQTNTNVEYVGITEVIGHPAHQVRLTAQPTGNSPAHIEEQVSEFHVFIDAQSLLLLKTLSFDFSPEIVENRSPVETYFSDYRSVEGLLVPHKIVRYVDGQKQCETSLSVVRLNVGISDSEFQ